MTGFAVDQDLAGIGRAGPGQGTDQRRLAGAVAADEADDLARIEVDADAVDGVDAAERDADVAHLDERRRRLSAPALRGGGMSGRPRAARSRLAS